jgi:hypothetical protein
MNSIPGFLHSLKRKSILPATGRILYAKVFPAGTPFRGGVEGKGMPSRTYHCIPLAWPCLDRGLYFLLGIHVAIPYATE